MTTSSAPTSTPIRILIVNPNTNTSMTDSLRPIVESLGYQSVIFEYFTCPEPGIYSINSPDDSKQSAEICLPHLLPYLPFHDAFLIACYSQHPLVAQLKVECDMLTATAIEGKGGTVARKYVTGILEASVNVSMSLISCWPPPSLLDDSRQNQERQAFGIVSTASVWSKSLSKAVYDLFGATGNTKFLSFAGCETTGLNGDELHTLPLEIVKGKMTEATKKLLRLGTYQNQDVKVICLGCAGMAGLEETVRDACIEEMGETRGKLVHIVDGVKAGVGCLISIARAGY